MVTTIGRDHHRQCSKEDIFLKVRVSLFLWGILLENDVRTFLKIPRRLFPCIIKKNIICWDTIIIIKLIVLSPYAKYHKKSVCSFFLSHRAFQN